MQLTNVLTFVSPHSTRGGVRVNIALASIRVERLAGGYSWLPGAAVGYVVTGLLFAAAAGLAIFHGRRRWRAEGLLRAPQDRTLSRASTRDSYMS